MTYFAVRPFSFRAENHPTADVRCTALSPVPSPPASLPATVGPRRLLTVGAAAVSMWRWLNQGAWLISRRVIEKSGG